MLYFQNDYSNGACEQVLKALISTNNEYTAPYGDDKYSISAREKIKKAIDCPQADIHFLVGGTQTNKVVISALLKPYQGVISADTGHINLHEGGAIESSGHKVMAIKHQNGKITADDLTDYLETYFADDSREHMVYPGMVYISHPTEYGTLYTKSELESLYNICKEYKIPLFLDGARLGYGVMADDTDVTLADVAKYTDVFYIGGTKVGTLCGEAVVFTKNNTPEHFLTQIKLNGAMLAKGRLAGVQFDALFTDNTYLEISKNAIKTAKTLKEALAQKGYRFFINSPTNQIFIIMPNKKLKELKDKVTYSRWEKYDDENTVIRFVTSWSTKPEDVKALIELL